MASTLVHSWSIRNLSIDSIHLLRDISTSHLKSAIKFKPYGYIIMVTYRNLSMDKRMVVIFHFQWQQISKRWTWGNNNKLCVVDLTSN